MKTTVYAGTPLEPEIPKCENAQDWAISRDTDLAWLAGILDGEGYIGISGWEKKIVKRVTITNTNYDLLQKVSRILKELNLRFHYQYCKPTTRNEEFMMIVISSYGSIKKLLNSLMPFLTAKKAQARKMIEFIAYRENTPYRSPEFAYGDKFKQYIAEIKAMKVRSPGLSTTTRVASQMLPEMVV